MPSLAIALLIGHTYLVRISTCAWAHTAPHAHKLMRKVFLNKPSGHDLLNTSRRTPCVRVGFSSSPSIKLLGGKVGPNLKACHASQRGVP